MSLKLLFVIIFGYFKNHAAELPSVLTIEQSPKDASDFAVSGVNLTCTTNCVSSKPDISWILVMNGKIESQWTPNVSKSNMSCRNALKMYTSKLDLPKYATFPGNSNASGYFQCAVLNTQGSEKAVYSSPSAVFLFAVKVTNVTIVNGEGKELKRVAVVANKSKNITCVVSLSRPASTVVLYLDGREVQRSTTTTKANFTFIPTSGDDGKMMYCEASNLQPENETVKSDRLSVAVGEMLMPPKLFLFMGFLADGSPNFVLEGGDNGGFLQTFIIEISDNSYNTWSEILKFREDDVNYRRTDMLYTFNVSGLSPGKYLVRAIAENEAWRLEDSLVLVTEVTIEREVCPSSNLLVYIVGGASGGVGIILTITIVCIYKKINCHKGKKIRLTYHSQELRGDTTGLANPYAAVAVMNDSHVMSPLPTNQYQNTTVTTETQPTESVTDDKTSKPMHPYSSLKNRTGRASAGYDNLRATTGDSEEEKETRPYRKSKMKERLENIFLPTLRR